MCIDKAIEEAQKFIALAQEYKQEFYGKKHKGYGQQYRMKTRAKMKRKTMDLSEALIAVRNRSAYDDKA